MALRLAGEEFSVVQGLDELGWLRSIEANDSTPGLKVKQSGAGAILEFYDGSAKVLSMDDGGALTLLGRDIALGSNKLTTTNLLLKEISSNRWGIKNAADTAYIGLIASDIDTANVALSQSNAALIKANNVDAAYAALQARDTGVGLVEVARMVGAAEPHFLFTHGKVGSLGSLPTAGANFRGFIYRVEGGAGVADVFYICEKNAADAYVWRAI